MRKKLKVSSSPKNNLKSQILVPKSRDWLKHTLQRETTMRDEKLNIQDLEAKDMNRDIDSSRYDISDPRNPLNMRRRGAK